MDPSYSPAAIDDAKREGEGLESRGENGIASTSMPSPKTGDVEVANTITRRRVDRSDGHSEAGAGSSSSLIEFVEYIPPTPPSLPPPPKYKLWLIVLILAFILVWLGNNANIVANNMSSSGWLNINASMFVYLAIIIIILTYAMAEVAMHCCTAKIRGTAYGLEAWLKQPRIQWVRRTNSDRNWILEMIACIVIVLEDGFQIFNPPQRMIAHHKKQSDHTYFEHDETELDNHQDEEEEPKAVVLRIEHHINPDKWKKYCAWRKQLTKLMHVQPGLFTISQGTSILDPNSELQVLHLKFISIDHLNAYMHSPSRTLILAKLQPLLLAPSVFQLQKDRLLPDTFTDLLTRQGEGVPALLPKKWKVVWLSTIGLWVVIFLRDMILPFYFDKWGLDNAPEWIQMLVKLVVAFFFNAYAVTPFLMMIFSEWVRRKEGENDEKEPWRTLNDGFRWIWLKVAIVTAYCGGCVIAWALRPSTK